MINMRIIFTYLLLLLSPPYLSAQIIWQEDFNAYTDGTTVGTTGRWTSTCGACLSGDFFEVRSGAFSAQDVNDFSTWESESINISGVSDVTFALDAIETGDHEGPGCACGVNIDYFDVSYSIDGGAFITIEDWNGDGEPGHTLTGDSQNGSALDADWESTTITQSGLSGNTLVLRVVMRNTAGTETMTLDNVVVSHTSLLPVNLVSFTAMPQNNLTQLYWQTSSEEFSSHFELEKSIDGIYFQTIGNIAAIGTSKGAYYHFEDLSLPQTVYYRLKSFDTNESFYYSDIISVTGKHSITNTPYPNPFANELFLKLSDHSNLTFLSIDGKKQKVISLPEGLHDLHPYLEGFPTGMIILNISSQYGTQKHKLIKLREKGF